MNHDLAGIATELEGIDIMTQDITPPPRPASAGQTLVEYILEKTGAAPKTAPPTSGGGTLVDYILEKTGAASQPPSSGGANIRPTAPAATGGSLVDYILEKTGAAPKPATNGAAKGPSLVDYILEKTTGAKAKINGADAHKGVNGATPMNGTPPPGGTLKDWILNQTNGSSRL